MTPKKRPGPVPHANDTTSVSQTSFVSLPRPVALGRIREETHSRGTPIPVADTLIAATARPLRLCVLSHDEHFRWVPRLAVEDWLA